MAINVHWFAKEMVSTFVNAKIFILLKALHNIAVKKFWEEIIQHIPFYRKYAQLRHRYDATEWGT